MSDQELIYNGFNIDANYRSQIKNLQSSESEYDYYGRSKETMKKLIKLHRKTGGTILIVAHAPSLEVLTRHLMNGQPRPQQLIDLAGRVAYCSMTIVDGAPSLKSWQFRYSLDERANQQQIQLNNMALRSATVGHLPTTLSTNYMIPAATSQFQYFQ
jgi:broad specificity phosphatase PhoE